MPYSSSSDLGSYSCKVLSFIQRTPLTVASRNGNIDVVRYLIEHGVNVNAADNDEVIYCFYNLHYNYC